MPNEFMTTAEVADMLRVGEATVQRWVRDGILPYTRIPGTKAYLFKVADVERMLDQARREA